MKTNLKPAASCLLRLLPATLLLLLGGCTLGKHSRPARFYVLNSLPEETAPLSENASDIPYIGVGPVEIPSYLDRPQVVFRIAENELSTNEFQRWAEPLSDGTTRILRENLSELLGPEKVIAFPWLSSFKRDYEIHVVILRFEPQTTTREVELRVFWRLLTPGERDPITVRESSYRRPLNKNESDYSHMVQVMSDVWVDFCLDIAQAVLELPKPESSEN